MNRTILVTGASGFVGTHALERAGAHGLEAVAARGDLRDADTAEALVRETSPSAVLHLASTRARAGDDAWRWLADDLRMAGNVLSAVASHAPQAPVLVPGSAAEYGLARPEPVSEATPVAPVSTYGAVKSVLEEACTARALRGNVRVIWARSFNHVGHGQGLFAPQHGGTRQVVVHDMAKDGGLQVLPLAFVLADRDEVLSQENA